MSRAVLASICILCLLGGTPVFAGQNWFSASGTRADELDVETLLALAEQGDTRASYLLGTRYASGRGGTRDDSEAVRWFTRAADAGLAEAQYNLGIMYAQGRGVAKDPQIAYRWTRQAADQGMGKALYRLGIMYVDGEGVEQDFVQALELFRRAGDKDVAGAQYNAGLLYEFGRGAPAHLPTAVNWYQRAADNGIHEAAVRLQQLDPQHLIRGDAPPAAVASATPSIPQPAADESPASAPADTSTSTSTSTSTTQAAAAPADVNHAAAVSGPAWFTAQDPARYTVQLAVSENEDYVRQFIARHGLEGIATYVPTLKNGAPMYTVVAGSHARYADAVASIKDLPQAIQKAGAFARRIRVIAAQMPHAD